MSEEQNALWLRGLLIQQFVLRQGGGPLKVSYTEVETLWDAGLIERVHGLSEDQLELVEGMSLAEARAAIRVRNELAKRPAHGP